MHLETQRKTPSLLLNFHILAYISFIFFVLILTHLNPKISLNFKLEMRRSSEFLKACLRLVVLVGFLRFLIVEAHHHHHHQKPRSRDTGRILVMKKEGSGNMKNDFVEAVKRKHKLELNYMSKRRVPNGPDPIHNRGAGKSHRPPGHA